MNNNKIKLVKRGYEVAAGKYREEKNLAILDLMIFNKSEEINWYLLFRVLPSHLLVI